MSRTVKSKGAWVSCGTTATRRAISRRDHSVIGRPSSVTEPRLRTERAAENLQQRGLAGAVRAENADQIAAVDGRATRDRGPAVGREWNASATSRYENETSIARSMARLLPASVAPKKDAPEWPGFLTRGSRQRVDVFPGCHPVTGRRPSNRAQGLREALLPAYSGETVWASHPLRVAAGVSVDCSRGTIRPCPGRV